MALDFPATPLDGATYDGPNGVRYQWNAAQGLWLAVTVTPPPPGGTGAVQAGSGNFTPVLNTDVVIVFPTVIGGNEGGWLNLANGRYVPPAGKYFIQSTFAMQAPTGGNGTWLLSPRKNGARIPVGAYGSGSAQFSVPITVGCYVDANGTDYFDFVGNILAAGMAVQGGGFTAFPLTGIQGPSGPVGAIVGDFWAQSSLGIPATNYAVIVPATVMIGNAGGWYNPQNGRYVPPAGRYVLRANIYCPNSTSAVGLLVKLRKNGVTDLSIAGQVPASAGWSGDPEVEVMVDSTGSDYFEVLAYGGSAQTVTASFLAYPVRGGS